LHVENTPVTASISGRLSCTKKLVVCQLVIKDHKGT
jgi:hypothetical protein